MTGDEEAIKDTTHHMYFTQEPPRKEMQFEHMMFLVQICCHFGIFLMEISTPLLKQVRSSRIFLTFYKTETVVKRQKMPRKTCHS